MVLGRNFKVNAPFTWAAVSGFAIKPIWASNSLAK